MSVIRTNLKKADNFTIGGFARSSAFGTRVYKVLDVWNGSEKRRVVYMPIGATEPRVEYSNFPITKLRLAKVGETNKGRFRFCNGKPFETSEKWYYPARAKAFAFATKTK